MQDQFSKEEMEKILKIARESIEFYFKNQKIPKFEVSEKLKKKERFSSL